jgi:dolichol-phosphate mannosyltransferase
MALETSIIIPTYNEKDNICLLVEQIQRILLKSAIPHQIIIVDDNSPDRTGVIAKDRFKDIENVLVIIKENERGLAKALETGIGHARYDIVVFMDADFSHNPEDLPALINYAGKYDIVNTSRFIKTGRMDYSMYWQFLSPLINKIIKIILKLQTTDNTDGFFAIRKNTLDRLPFDKIFYGYGDYQFRLFFYAAKNKAGFFEMPTHYLERRAGRSKTRVWVVGWRYILSALRLWLPKKKKTS